MEDKIINIIVDENSGENRLAARSSIDDFIKKQIAKSVKFEIDALKEQMTNSYAAVIKCISQLPDLESEVELEKVQFTLALDSSGKVSLLSSISSSISAKTGFTFTVSYKKG